MPRSEKLKMLEDLVATTHCMSSHSNALPSPSINGSEDVVSNDEVVALQTMFNSIQSGEKVH
jgi:hypothetical protein